MYTTIDSSVCLYTDSDTVQKDHNSMSQTSWVKMPLPHWSDSRHCSNSVFRPSVMILPFPFRIQKRTNGPTRGSEHLTTRPARTWTHFPFNILGKLGRTEGGGLLNTNTWMAYIWLTYVRLRACLIFHELCKRVGIHTLITTLRGILFSAADLRLSHQQFIIASS